jgi:hypothetical protein
VTVDHVARVAVRHPEVVAAGRHYGVQVATCVPFDPESKGGSEASVRIAKADLVPTEANLLDGYPDMTTLVAACDAFCVEVNGRRHRETNAIPAERLATERARLHVLPSAPYTAALGETRLVNTDQTVRFGSVRYSTPPGLVGAEVWVRAAADELVIVADLNALPARPSWAPTPPAGLVEVARHALSTPGRPRIELAHYPGHPQDPSGAAPATVTAPDESGGVGVPVPRPGRRSVAGRGGRRGRGAGPGQDGRRGRARRPGRP